MDRYWKEALEGSTWKYDIKGSVSLRYKESKSNIYKTSTKMNSKITTLM